MTGPRPAVGKGYRDIGPIDGTVPVTQVLGFVGQCSKPPVAEARAWVGIGPERTRG
jgi:hypothetical protein